MQILQTIKRGFQRWLDTVAEAIIALVAWLIAARTVRLVEGPPGQFTIDADTGAARRAALLTENSAIADHQPPPVEAALRGARVELVLLPNRFVFKPVDLPARATEFLGGVVRAQIDRLTPWSADRAAFGFSPPVDAGSGRIVVTVAATATALLAPFRDALTKLGVRSLLISTAPPEEAAASPIVVLEENVARILNINAARRVLLGVLAGCVFAVVAASIAASIVGSDLEERQDELARRIGQRRAAMLMGHEQSQDPMVVSENALMRKKNETPSAVMTLELLSRAMPDHTYLTELRIEADKVRVTGITHDAPALIRLMEQTRQFAEATFFAPITRAPSEKGDRFNIEARVEPSFQ
jgi:general secretion pathway protein L